METVFPCRSPEEILKRDQAQSDGISLPAAGSLQGVPDQECPVKTTFKVEFPDDWKLAVPPVFNDKHHLNNNSAASLSDNEPENAAFPAAAVFFSGTSQYEDDCSTSAVEEKKVAPTPVKAASLYSDKTISEVKSSSSSKRRRILDHCEVEADGLQFLNSYSIALAMDTDEKSVEFCQKLGLLPMKTCCPLCGDILNQIYTVKRKYKRTASRFQCNRRSCKQSGKNTVSVKDKSWFQNSSLSYRKNLIIMKCYVEGMETFITIRESSIPEENSKGEVGTAITSSESVIDLYAACREVCAMSMLEFSAETVIGGLGKTVELGESCFERFKNRSEVQNHWMLAGICRETDKVFLDKVPFGNPEAVLDVVRRHVKSGTHIITQCSPVIQCMSQCFQDGYTYSTGISEGLQQTPSKKNTETKHWVSVRKHFPFARITGGVFALHLAELLWRRKHRQDRDPFRSFIGDIKKLYEF